MEASNEALYGRLQNLQKLNNEQQNCIASYLDELQEEQQRTSELLGELCI